MNNLKPNDYSVNELHYHLNIMKETLCKDKSLKPDFFSGFIEFFNNEIQLFNTTLSDKNKIVPLASDLSDLEQTIDTVATQIKPETLTGDVIVPRIGTKVETQVLAGHYKEGNVKSGLEIISGEYDVYPIKGDGHCLFRTFLGHLLLQFPKLQDNTYNQFMESQVNFVGDKQKLRKGYDLLKSKLDEIRAVPLNEYDQKFNEIMLDAKVSDQLVKYLRRLAVEHHKLNTNEALEADFIASSGSVEKYLDDMEKMSVSPALGGHPEIIALSDILGVRTHVLNCDGIGQGDSHNSPHHFHGNLDSELTFPLLFRPGHFDMAVAKGV